MQLAEIMSARVVSVELDDKLSDIQAIFENVRFHHIMVVENGRLFGVISDRDLLKHLSPFVDTVNEQARDRATLNKRAHHIMSRRLVTAPPEMDVRQAARLMIEQNVSCLPVVGKKGEALGVVSWKDLLRASLSV